MAVSPGFEFGGLVTAIGREVFRVPIGRHSGDDAGSANFLDAISVQLVSSDEPFDTTKRTDNPPFTIKDAFVDWMVKHTEEKAAFLDQRWDLAALLGNRGDFKHERVREAFLRTPREYFCGNRRCAYAIDLSINMQ